ncbi:hypothetical protein SteCoe_37140 [Stentor coeruleus]|uniref:Uncharacterized protein n=1 Tax=Stentor coeruleus TaxID=5963 RepID=A0A1R2ANP2_9CILI|nr:hypothetical protein SteCoe_37140 [Stentor coeruleus]
MEEAKNNVRPGPKSILGRKSIIKHASTYGPTSLNISVDKKKKKKVAFVDRANNLNLCTVFNYEQVDIVDEEKSPKSTSCACIAF